MQTFKRCLVIFFVLSCCIGCDQVSKEAARRTLQGSAMTSWWYDTIRLQYTENRGAFLSVGSHFPTNVRFWILIMIPGIFLFGMLGVSVYSAEMLFRVRIALALIIGGGLSNLFDRLVQDGRVTDFLNIGIGPLRTGIFNFADVMIIVGAGTLLLYRVLLHNGPKILKSGE